MMKEKYLHIYFSAEKQENIITLYFKYNDEFPRRVRRLYDIRWLGSTVSTILRVYKYVMNFQSLQNAFFSLPIPHPQKVQLGQFRIREPKKRRILRVDPADQPKHVIFSIRTTLATINFMGL